MRHQDVPTIVVDNRSNAVWAASFVFGLICIFILTPLFVQVATSPLGMGITVPMPSRAELPPLPKARQPIEKVEVSDPAVNDAALVGDARLCTRYLPRQEKQFGIPPHLLAAIASIESGRYNKALGLNFPWPWTIKTGGKQYIFNTKQKAINAARSFQKREVADISVGCMQVNLLQYPHAFATLDQAFDPAYNSAYAARLLKKGFDQEGSWRKATADYHSHDPQEGAEYARIVFDQWTRILTKVADARIGKPVSITSQ